MLANTVNNKPTRPGYAAVLTPDKFLSKEEEGRLLLCLEKWREEKLRDTTLFLFMLKTGARPSEALLLTWGDINVEDRSVYLRTLKKGMPRILPLTTNLLARIKKLGCVDDNERVFKLSYPRLIQVWAEMRPAKKRPHCLRHTFAVNFYKNSGYDLLLTQQALGHHRLESTSVYLQIHCSVDDFRKAIGD